MGDMIHIVVPVYNNKLYLKKCVDSILKQTYQNIRIVLVDDGSTDGSGDICDEYLRADNRVHVIHQSNSGASVARNAGIEFVRQNYSTGYIAFVDSDDYIDPNMYEEMIDIALQQDADIVECGYRWIKPEGIVDKNNTGKTHEFTGIEACEQLYFGEQLYGGISIVPWNKLYNISLFKDIRYPEGIIYEDVATTPRLLYNATKVIKYDKNLYNFYFSPNSVTRSGWSKKNLDSIEATKIAKDFFGCVGAQRIEQFVESLYFNNLLTGFYESTVRNFLPERNMLKNMLLSEKKRMYANGYIGQSFKVRLFFLFPQIWVLFYRIYRKIRPM